MYKTTSFLVVSLFRNKEKRVNYTSLWLAMLINMLVSEANKQGNWLSYTFSLYYHSNPWNHETMVTTLLLKQLICFYSGTTNQLRFSLTLLQWLSCSVQKGWQKSW